MSFRFVPIPLETPLALPEPRDGGLHPSLHEAFVPSPAREAALARLAEPGALAVTSGQQPGLFTGPLYTVHKALSTAALARVLERQWSRPVVPIFWIAGDDHDFAEASQVAGAITPVPGGVGPMTIAVLLRNTIVSAHRREKLGLPKALL